jgi:hypothetical protein
MIRSLLTLSTVAAVFALAGCASQPAAPSASAAPAAATANNDAATAAKLKGNWTGQWTLPGFGGGKFELIVTEVNGNNVSGNANWYGTAVGDLKETVKNAPVQNGTLTVNHGSIPFKLTLKGDTLAGTWSAGGYEGPLTAKR